MKNQICILLIYHHAMNGEFNYDIQAIQAAGIQGLKNIPLDNMKESLNRFVDSFKRYSNKT